MNFSTISQKIRTYVPALILVAAGCTLLFTLGSVPKTSARFCEGDCPSPTPSPTASGSVVSGTGSVATGTGSTGGGVVFPFSSTGGGVGGPVFSSPSPTPNASPTPKIVPTQRPRPSFVPITTPLPTPTPGVKICQEYLTARLRYGANNDQDQVRKLQSFLRDHEDADVVVTGIFDRKTLSAVRAFQQKYASDILSPWHLGYTTGIVSITTRKKINELVCNTPRELTPEEWQAIQNLIG